ncbi:DUF1120 domain-containing protein [Cronobacter dublinensis]|uniref:DUF1120 domain-containing protein n=1 Tax=Cronobacter dublinensis TaxID=413497 RepID=UPI0013756243|nr:DUF1120 domain-containing protein [Cronobacter dublinensis]EKY3091026.1 DUF1120 domain-containing protein [Cronobacter dublinensis]ELQ6230393.1 DUF1120 domain-containing protein [Cronobacter dublinensis]ELY4006304.1 DUF1120 domain-containing protein [Cronobacter dublinensis]ELY4408370.1 DUF1120 domain-containing protein [Cronobacter dublinensis]ELY5821432.1 DUF1120 domain-containing protein [Cronobacter dublinensis]
MKKILFTSMLLALASGAQAADTVELKVTGTLVNGACTPVIENGGVIDLGHIPVKNMTAEGTQGYYPAQYQHKKVSLDITCTTAMNIGFNIVDNKPGTVPDSFSTFSGVYGMGKTSDDKKIGVYQLYYNQATVDGVTGKVIYAVDHGSVWKDAAALNHGNGEYTYSFADAASNVPKSGKDFSMKIDTTYYFDKTLVDNLQDDIPFDGSATFSLVYL